MVDLTAGSYASTVLAVLTEREECPVSAAQAVPLPAILVCPLSLGLHTLFTGSTAVCVALWTQFTHDMSSSGWRTLERP